MPKQTVKKVLRWFDRVRRVAQCYGESKTQKSHAGAADVNNIVARFQRTGELPPNPRGQEPTYADVTHLQQELTQAYNDSLQQSAAILEDLEYAREQKAAQDAESAAEPQPDQQQARAARAESGTQTPENTPPPEKA